MGRLFCWWLAWSVSSFSLASNLNAFLSDVHGWWLAWSRDLVLPMEHQGGGGTRAHHRKSCLFDVCVVARLVFHIPVHSILAVGFLSVDRCSPKCECFHISHTPPFVSALVRKVRKVMKLWPRIGTSRDLSSGYLLPYSYQ